MISIIVAIADNYCIGKNNKIPWHIPEDFKYFKEKTSGKTVIMGANTFESILGYLGKPLPERKNVVLNQDENYSVPEGVFVFNSIPKALDFCKDDGEVFFIGGASIYRQAIEIVDRLYITEVHQTVDGDTFFPKIDANIWAETSRDDRDGFSFVIYDRIKK